MSSIFAISDLHLKKEKMTILKDEYREKTSAFFREKIHPSDLLLVCGDLIDKGGSENTDEVLDNAKYTLDYFCSFGCAVMFVPGNHDISDDLIDIDGQTKYDRINKILKCINEKHKNLIFTNTINENQVVVSRHIFNNNVLVIGLNSTCSIGRKHESGHIDIDQLKEEFEQIKAEVTNYDEMHKVVVIHHNCYPVGESENELQDNNRDNYNGNISNASELKSLFDFYKIEVVISGHTHGNQSVGLTNYLDDKTRNYITVGSLEIQGSDSISFSEFIISDIGVFQSQVLHAFTKVNHIAEWNQLKEVSFRTNSDSPYDVTFNGSNDSTSENKHNSRKEYCEDAIGYIKDRVREKKLLKTGHFCNNDECTLTWIDTTPFISDARKLDKICSFFEKIFFNELKKSDVLIGLGMKGTILVNALSHYSKNEKVVYYPDDDDDQINETSFFRNELKKCHSPIIVIDVYNTGKTIEKFYKKFNDCFNNKNVQVLCIFNRSNVKACYNEINNNNDNVVQVDNQYNEYRLFALCSIPRISCENKRNQCPIYLDQLCEISF